MRPKQLLGLLIPLACAGLFVRLGIWQLSRHRERAAYNAQVSARMAEPPMPFDDLVRLALRDTGAVRGRRATLDGRYRYDLEQVHAGRVHAGAPAVDLLTPVERGGTAPLVFTVRAWVRSPDAATVDGRTFREDSVAALSGYVLPLAPDGPPPPSDAAVPLRRLSVAALARRSGREVAPLLFVVTDPAPAGAGRVGPPTVSPGNHRSYAIQWFAFAGIAVVGGVALYRRSGAAGGRITPRARAGTAAPPPR